MARREAHFIFVLILVADLATALIINTTVIDEIEKNDVELPVKTRRQGGGGGGRKKSQSTSSEGQRRSGEASAEASDESLAQSFTGSETSTDTDERNHRVKKDRTPKSTQERRGWRKWHRKCTRCPEDMRMKWRDPNIKWICGAYQRARRSFKSLCMMHYRNCQDGTMFTKIGDHRCPNASGQVHPHGDHFFYEYTVVLTDDDTDSEAVDDDSTEEESSSSWDSSRIAKLPPLPPRFD